MGQGQKKKTRKIMGVPTLQLQSVLLVLPVADVLELLGH